MIKIHILFAVAALALSIFDFLRLEIWSQIEYIYSINQLNVLDPGLLVHLPRFLVVYPSYIIGDILEIDPNKIFTIYVSILTSLTSLIWIKTQKLIVVYKKNRNYIFIFPFVLLSIINGRFMFALFGLSLLMYVLIKLKLKLIGSIAGIWIVISLLYASVSSGTFSVALLFMIFTSWRTVLQSILSGGSFAKCAKFLIGFLVLTLLMYFLLLFLLKNLDYYGGGFDGAVNIISHGLGLVINPEPVLENCRTETGLVCTVSLMIVSSVILHVFLSILLIISLIILLFYIRYSKFHTMAKQGIIVSLIGGIFGFTTLMSTIFILPLAMKRSKIRGDF